MHMRPGVYRFTLGANEPEAIEVEVNFDAKGSCTAKHDNRVLQFKNIEALWEFLGSIKKPIGGGHYTSYYIQRVERG